MQDYTYIPKSNDVLDIEICNKMNEIEKLRSEIKQLELRKSKQNTDYIGRIFKMTDMGYTYVTGVDLDGLIYGMSFEDFDFSIEIFDCARFDPDKIEREVTVEEFRSIFKHRLEWDKLKQIME